VDLHSIKAANQETREENVMKKILIADDRPEVVKLVKEGKEAGANTVLIKPFDVRLLLKLLSNL